MGLHRQSSTNHFRTGYEEYGYGRHHGHGVIDNALPKHKHVDSGINIDGLEDCKRRNGVHGGDKCPKHHRIKERQEVE